MRYYILLLVTLLSLTVHGQQPGASDPGTADSNYNGARYPFYSPHCRATTVGRRLMFAGTGVAATGAGLWAYSHYAGGKDARFEMAVISFSAAIAVNMISYGLVTYVVGRVVDRKRAERFSLVADYNRLGIAYNFR